MKECPEFEIQIIMLLIKKNDVLNACYRLIKKILKRFVSKKATSCLFSNETIRFANEKFSLQYNLFEIGNETNLFGNEISVFF